mgnify:FL=1
MAKKEKVTPEIEEEVEVAPVEEETEVEVAPEIEEEVEVAPVEEEVEVAPVDDEMDLDAEFGVDAESFDEEMKKAKDAIAASEDFSTYAKGFPAWDLVPPEGK